ncbi:Surface antigen protein [Labilithrix luteola]|uniref:Surface antigen protein n=1 Tax=Labilithrix luteola TaxID=1391654 RepID=A0A0K1QCL0_9BACT|nr:YncE family protein [Labilithrix luteola]AKV03463.1 Surface antigen protein [Labilithrix luteola]
MTSRASTLSLYLGRASVALVLVFALVVAALASAGCSGCKKTAQASAGPLTAGARIDIPAERAAYVTDNGSDAVSVIDRDGDAVVNVPLDLDPDVHEAPHHLALDSSTKNVFVALAFPPETASKKGAHANHGSAASVGRLVRLDLGTLAVQQLTDVDENPGDVVLTHDRKKVLVTHFDMKRAMDVAAQGGASPATMFARLTVFDASTMKLLAARAVCVAPHGVVTSRDDKTAFVACYGSDELAIIDLTNEALSISRHPLGLTPGVPGVPRYGPYSALLSPDESRVIVANLEGQDLRIFDRREKRFLADKTVPLAAKAFMPAFVDARTVMVPLQSPDGLALVDVESSKVVTRTSFPKSDCTLPHAVRVARDGRAYLVCEGDHRAPGTILEIDPKTLAAKRRWSVGVYPDGISFGDE